MRLDWICFLWCHATMCLLGLKGAVRSTNKCRAPTLAGDCQTLFNVTDITNSQAEPHFKATGRVISEMLIVNAANWVAFPTQIQGLRQIQFFQNKKVLRTAVFWLTRLTTIFFY